jgi:hypothetical protein
MPFNKERFVKNIYVTMGLFLGFAVSATAAPRTNCVDPQSFKEKIYNCGQNKVAVKIARLCAGEMRARMTASGAELDRSMKALQAEARDTKQNKSLTNAIGQLDSAMEKLADDVAYFQKNTALVASYNDVMIDDQNSESEEQSPECFNENHDALQDLVDELDEEIMNAKKAYDKAESMATSLDKANVSLDSLPNAAPLSGPATPAPAAKAPTPTKKAPKGSDISGTEPEKK